MSLDVYLTVQEPTLKKSGSGIFVRRGGETKEITVEEWNLLHPGEEPVRLIQEEEYLTNEVFSANITHNLNTMAEAAGIYNALWRPYKLKIINFKFGVNGDTENIDYDKEYEFEKNCIIKANELIEPLRQGLHELKLNPTKYKELNPENGWGSYDGLVKFVDNYLNACYEYPDAIVEVGR